MPKLMECRKTAPVFTAEANQECFLLQKGQRVIYEKEEAEVISVRPLLVIKTKNRVVCGALQKRF